jgi:hypothetical protein
MESFDRDVLKIKKLEHVGIEKAATFSGHALIPAALTFDSAALRNRSLS